MNSDSVRPQDQNAWKKRLKLLIFLLDLCTLVIGALLAFWLRFDGIYWEFNVRFSETTYITFSYAWALTLITGLILFLLSALGTTSEHVIGGGSREYSLVAQAVLYGFAVSIFILFATNASFSRQVLFSFLVFAMSFLLIERWLCRRWLNRQRRKGKWFSRVLIVGTVQAADEVMTQLNHRYYAGLAPVGVCYINDDSFSPGNLGSIEKYRGITQIELALDSTNADSVLVVGSDGMSPSFLREISWAVDPLKHNLILSTGLVDVSGPRIHMRQIPGLPLVYMDVPSFRGIKRATKRVIDLLLTIVGAVIVLPLGLIIALTIRLESAGPVFFTQSRIGLDNKSFKIYKFRSMRIDAEDLKATLTSDVSSEPGSPLFKVKSDPRVTRVGSFIRKWSLDELPQLLNVLIGNMSLVGPRPPLPSEVEKYEEHVTRKFLVKPGITGLWQISGRSNLSWEESVRLDLYYVENWSIFNDFVILFRTVISVLKRDGAY